MIYLKLTPAGRKYLSHFSKGRIAYQIRADVAERLLNAGYITEELYEAPEGYWPRYHYYHRITDAGRAALKEQKG